MEKAAGSHFHQHDDVKGAKSGRDDNEEVAGRDHLGVMMDEGEPALLGVGRRKYRATVQGKLGFPVSVAARWRCVPVPTWVSRPFISRLTALRLLGRRGRLAVFDFQRQKRRNPWRCQRRSVSAWTCTRASRQASHLGHQRCPGTCGESHPSDQVDGNQRQGPQAVHNGEVPHGTRQGIAQDRTLRNVTGLPLWAPTEFLRTTGLPQAWVDQCSTPRNAHSARVSAHRSCRRSWLEAHS